MARMNAPGLGLGASGSIGDAMTYSTWRGRPYLRRKVTPSNPKSATQQSVRAMMKFLAQLWSTLSAPDQSTYSALAAANNVPYFNAYQKVNMKRWSEAKYPSQEYPAAEAGTPQTAGTHTATGGQRAATLALKTTTAADGWGYMIHRSTTTGFTPGYTNSAAVVAINGTTDVPYIDHDLDADTYYYKMTPFTIDGLAGTPSAEINAVVT